jgi:lysophospholipid hydrolase
MSISEPHATITTAIPEATQIAPSNNLATYVIYRVIQLLFGRVPYGIYRLLTYTVTATVTLDFWGILYLTTIIGLVIILYMRSRVVDPYTRLEQTTQVPKNTFDLKPDATIQNDNAYPDEFMNAFLSSIKVFGYLDKPVFHELAKNLQTKKLQSGDILFDENSQDRDFYVVVDGKIQVFIKGDQKNQESDDGEEEGNHLLNEVKQGGTVTSLFAILSVLSEDLELPKPLVHGTEELCPKDESTLTSIARADKDSSNASDGDNHSSDEGITPSTKLYFENTPLDPSKTPEPPRNIEDGARDIDRDGEEDVVRNVHPNLIAKAASNTTLAVIPASAFRRLSEKYPKAASQMAQVILTRFQRVTFLTLHRYLGLSSELLSIEKKVNEIAGSGLPSNLFDAASIESLSWRLSHQHTDSLQDLNNGLFRQPSSKKPSNIVTDESVSGVDLGFSDVEKKQRKYLRELTEQSFTTGESDEKLKDAIFNCIAQLIGLTPSKEEAKESTPTSSVRSGAPFGASIERFYYSTRRSSITSLSTTSGRRSGYFDFDEISVSSRTSSVDDSDNEISEVDIKFYKQGDILLKEGDRSPGLFFVLDGTIEASTTPSKDLLDIQRQWSHTESRARKKTLFLIHPGGLAGYLAALTGNNSFVTLCAKTDVLVGIMPKVVLDRYVDKYPNVSLCLAKRLVNQLSPLVFHIDVALEWGQVNAGQTLCHQGDRSAAIFIVLNGRLRSIREQGKDGTHSLEIQGEHGQSDSVGELEVLIDAPRPATIHAIRDSEIAIMPKTLFNALAIRHPEVLMTISRMIAIRSRQNDQQARSGSANENLKTVALLPVNGEIPILEFAERLTEAFLGMNVAAGCIHTRTVMSQLGRHAFTKLGRLKLLSWLAEQEESHRIVLYVADGGVNAPWTQRCIRQVCLFHVG